MIEMNIKYIKVSDDWFPNYPNDEVLVRLIDCDFHRDKYFRILVEGMDDFLMYKDYPYIDKEDRKVAEKSATELYNKIINTIPFSQEIAERYGLIIF